MAPNNEYGTDTVTGQRAVLYMGTLFQAHDRHAGVKAEQVALDARRSSPASLARLRVASRPSSWKAPRLAVSRRVEMPRRASAERRPRATRRAAGRSRARSKTRRTGAA